MTNPVNTRNEKRPLVLCDADGVLLDFMTPALETASAIAGRSITIDMITDWYLFDTIGREHEKACYREWDKPGFCSSLRPYDGAVDAMREMRKMVDVVVVTSPIHSSPTWCFERTEALKRYFDIPSRDVMFTSRKTIVDGLMLIDDRPQHVLDWSNAHRERGVGVVWEQPYNRKDSDQLANALRVTSWRQLLETVKAVLHGDRYV